jgi:MFS family permease
MNPPPLPPAILHASAWTTYGIGGLALVMAALLTGLAARSGWRAGLWAGVAIAAVMALQFGLARAGVLQSWNRFPPPFMLMFVPTLVLTIRWAFSDAGTKLAERLPFALLVGPQAFRLPLELLMHHAAREGVMPVQLSYSGWNFDIITGATALLVAALAHRPRAGRTLLLAWNLMGLALLAIVVGIALASMPSIHAFGMDRLNTWVTYAPLVWLPGVLVPTALFLHHHSLRKLWMEAGQARVPS